MSQRTSKESLRCTKTTATVAFQNEQARSNFRNSGGSKDRNSKIKIGIFRSFLRFSSHDEVVTGWVRYLLGSSFDELAICRVRYLISSLYGTFAVWWVRHLRDLRVLKYRTHIPPLLQRFLELRISKSLLWNTTKNGFFVSWYPQEAIRELEVEKESRRAPRECMNRSMLWVYKHGTCGEVWPLHMCRPVSQAQHEIIRIFKETCLLSNFSPVVILTTR